MFWDNFKNLCDLNGIAPNALAAELGLASGSITAWSKGSVPRVATIKKIADYFGVGVEDLTKEKKPAPTNGNGLEEEFLKLFSRLSPEAQEREIAYLRTLANGQGR